MSTMCMHPLDLVKVHFQVATAAHPQGPLDSAAPVASTSASTTTAPRIDVKGKGKAVPTSTSPATGIYHAVKRIAQRDGLKGLYRGLTPNLTGNAASWGFYFLWYTMVKARMQQWGYVSARKGDSPSSDKLSPAEHLAASASAGIITAVITNPLWVVKTRMFTTTANNKHAYRNVLGRSLSLNHLERLLTSHDLIRRPVPVRQGRRNQRIGKGYDARHHRRQQRRDPVHDLRRAQAVAHEGEAEKARSERGRAGDQRAGQPCTICPSVTVSNAARANTEQRRVYPDERVGQARRDRHHLPVPSDPISNTGHHSLYLVE